MSIYSNSIITTGQCCIMQPLFCAAHVQLMFSARIYIKLKKLFFSPIHFQQKLLKEKLQKKVPFDIYLFRFVHLRSKRNFLKVDVVIFNTLLQSTMFWFRIRFLESSFLLCPVTIDYRIPKTQPIQSGLYHAN